jgi:copper ion binding protein
MSDVETVLRVQGMTCGHCVKHVGEAVRGVPGVHAASVDLASGDVRVSHAAGASVAAMCAAIVDAGYEVATPASA